MIARIAAKLQLYQQREKLIAAEPFPEKSIS